MNFILASASPRRKEILGKLGITEMIVQPAKGEEIIPDNCGPEDTVKVLSRAKALEVAEDHSSDDVIIAADTIVCHDGKILGKPSDEQDAFDMLSALSGKSHEVYTGVTIIVGGRVLTEAEMTEVEFRKLSDEEIRAYINTGEPMDKAGAYGIQGRGSVLVKGINGDFFNVMGLPACRLYKMLSEQGVNLL